MTERTLLIGGCIALSAMIWLFVAGLMVIVGDWLWYRRRSREIASEKEKSARGAGKHDGI